MVACDKCKKEFEWENDFISVEGQRLCEECRIGKEEYIAPYLTVYDSLPDCPRGCDCQCSSMGEDDGDYWYCDECEALVYILNYDED